MRGLVVRNTGSWYQVKTDEGEIVDCRIKGNFRMKEIRSTNPIAVGDFVEFEKTVDGTAMIHHIEDRRNYIVRRSSNLSKHSHILATNLDLVALVVTINYPETSLVFIDRFLATAEAYRVPACIVFNKTDRYDEGELEYLKGLESLYTSLGYPVSVIVAPIGRTATWNEIFPIKLAACHSINQRKIFRAGIHKTVTSNSVKGSLAVVCIAIAIAVANANAILIVDVEAKYSIIRTAHKYFGFAIAIKIESCNIDLYIHGNVRAYVDCPKKGAIQFVGLEIGEISTGICPVATHSFNDYFVLSVAVKVGSSCVVRVVEVFS
jgi:translation initiation factor IF-1